MEHERAGWLRVIQVNGVGHITEMLSHDDDTSIPGREIIPRVARFVAWVTGRYGVVVASK